MILRLHDERVSVLRLAIHLHLRLEDARHGVHVEDAGVVSGGDAVRDAPVLAGVAVDGGEGGDALRRPLLLHQGHVVEAAGEARRVVVLVEELDAEAEDAAERGRAAVPRLRKEDI